MTTPDHNWSAVMRMVTCIERNGPISEKDIWIETGINDQKAALLKDLRQFQLINGRVRYNKKTQLWESATKDHVAGSRYMPEFREYHHDVYAHAWLRAGAMDYRSVPSRIHGA